MNLPLTAKAINRECIKFARGQNCTNCASACSRIQFKVVDSVKEIGNNRGGDLVPPEYGSNKKACKSSKVRENLELLQCMNF